MVASSASNFKIKHTDHECVQPCFPITPFFSALQITRKAIQTTKSSKYSQRNIQTPRDKCALSTDFPPIHFPVRPKVGLSKPIVHIVRLPDDNDMRESNPRNGKDDGHHSQRIAGVPSRFTYPTENETREHDEDREDDAKPYYYQCVDCHCGENLVV